ncbi:MAG: hypothetical protein DRQ49_19375 [Gammaproteobacteria bacterium]|nr:MAG: hypothetical protein DRQ49_19375 [Gammaproteobacteria bacterium]RKZ36765.1 MAG: hypothetical protein DRQ41_14065 [Gammaproteobacteria bacterium]RKZ73103.1 MAG: hypothetical protein DRQ57_15490 [Gammaproteobacteria bacterium]
MNFNPLSPVWQSYQASKNAFEIAKVANKHPDRENLFIKTEILYSQANAIQIIKQSKSDADELFVLNLWATFERFIRTYLQEKGQKLQEILPSSLASSIYPYFEKEVEFWKAEDILDLLKSTLAPRTSLIGQAKQILQYRNWIAHGKNTNKIPPQVTPVYAFDILNEIVDLILLNN